MVTSKYEWKILNTDEKLQTNIHKILYEIKHCYLNLFVRFRFFLRLDLSRLGFEQPTFRLQGEPSNPLSRRRGFGNLKI